MARKKIENRVDLEAYHELEFAKEPSDSELDKIEESDDETIGEPDINDALLDDSVRMYLVEIGRTPLLTRKDEVSLAKRMDIVRVITRLENKWHVEGFVVPRMLINRFAVLKEGANAEGARKQMIEANLRLVVSIAKKYMPRCVALSLLDLIQEGSIGLMRAVEKFDHEKGWKFSTYASWWIRQAVTRSIADHDRIIRMPVHEVEKYNKLQILHRRLTSELGREPTHEELANEMGVSIAKLEEMYITSRETFSLDEPLTSSEEQRDDPTYLSAYIVDDSAESDPEEMVLNGTRKEIVEKVLRTLTDREARVLSLRFGIDDGRQRTLEEVGKEFGVTRERIRQIEAKALRKLRHPSRARKLRAIL